MARGQRILMVLSSHGELGETGRSTGFYLSEAAEPWQAFTAAGCQIDVASPGGATPVMDPHGADLTDPAQQAFLSDPGMAAKLAAAADPADLDPGAYDAIFYAGGHGTMWDFPGDKDLAELARAIFEAGGAVSAVCHGPAALVNIALSDGRPLVADRAVTGFSNDEEESAGLTGVVPFSLQDALTERGGRYTAGPRFTSHVVVDGRLVTGQNPASAPGTAHALLSVLATAAR